MGYKSLCCFNFIIVIFISGTFALDLVPLTNPVPTGGNLTISLSPATTISSGSWLFHGLVIVFWYPGNTAVDADYGNRVTYNSATHQLILSPMTVNDSGEYVLQGIAPNLKVSVNVTVVEAIKQATLTASKTAPMEFTDSVTLNCSATGAVPTYTWYNGSSVMANGGTVQITNNGSLLTITNVTRYDTGPFKCLAANSVSSATSPTVTLNVSYGPSNMVLTASPDQTSYSTKSNITLTCNATSNPAATYSWSLNGNSLTTTSPTLVLNNVTVNNAGTYSCTAKNTATLKSLTVSKNISIVEAIKQATLTASKTAPMEFADSVTLNCSATGAVPTYTWYNGSSVMANGSTVQITNNGSLLTINNVTRYDTGPFKCLAANSVSSATSPTVTLNVSHGPSNVVLTASPDQTSYSTKSNITLTCTATSNPAATYSWSLNGTSFTTTSPTLVFNNVTVNNAGTYSCTAKNTATLKSLTVSKNISIVDDPWNVTISGPSVVAVNSSVTLNCTAASQPNSTYNWLFNGIKQADGPVYQIASISTNQSGEYTCTATNTVTGVSSSTKWNLTVLEPITAVSVVPGNAQPIYNTSFSLICNITGPVNTVYWIKNGVDQTNTSRIFITNQNRNLTLSQLVLSDNGLYQCGASNGLGKMTSEAYNLIVNYGPWNVTISGPTAVASKSSVTLTCTAASQPPSNISWWFNGVKLADGPVYQSASVLSNNSGQYTCKADNNVTTSSSTASWNLLVVGDPWNVTISGPSIVAVNSSVTLNCTAASQPNSTYNWLFNGIKQADGPVYQITSILANQSGEYTCTATNNVTGVSSSTKWNLTVLDDSWNKTTPGPSAVAVNSSVTLNCTAASQPNSTYNWFFNGIKQADGPVYQITSISANQSGEYTCTATNTVTGVSSSTKWNLTVLEPITAVSVVPGNAQPIYNTSFSLICNITGPVNTVYWIKNGVEQTNTSRISITNQNRNLTLSQLVLSDNGLYQCGASNGLGKMTSEAYNLIVNYGPWNVTISGPTAVASKSSVTLTCTAASQPPSNISWWFNGVKLADGPVYQSASVLSNNSGQYTCKADNNVTTSSSTASWKLLVVGDPWNVTISGPSVVAVNSSVTLNCTAASQPNSTYNWLFNGIKQADGPVYQIASISTNQSGEYTCTATNNATGVSSSTKWNLTVLDDSWNKTIPGPSAVAVNSSVTLNCTAASQQNSTYNWFFNGIKQADGPVYQITSISANQSGEYTCTATNTVTGVSSSTKWNLTVLEPITAVSVVPGNAQPIYNTSFSLICNITGPVNTVYWIKNGVDQTNTSRNSITNQNRNLTLSQLVLSDNGLYQCGASNGLGKMTSEAYNLIVNYGPWNVTISGPTAVVSKSSVTLTCTAASQPPSNISWWFNGVKLANGPVYQSASVLSNNSGQYTCKADNNVTTSSSTASWNLRVVDDSWNVTISGPSVVAVKSSVTLNCTASSQPNSTYNWFFNGIKQADGPVYQIASISANQSGEYTCTATNITGVSSSTKWNLTVLEPITAVSVVPGNTQPINSTSFTLFCNITGTGNTVYWTKNCVDQTNTSRISITNQNRTLTISQPVLSDNGMYQCGASNELGKKTSEPFNLMLNCGLLNLTISGPYIVQAKSLVTLNCTASSQSASSYAWLFTGTVVATTSLYQIPSIAANQGGEYTCQARNSVTGLTETVKWNLIVIDPTSGSSAVHTSVFLVVLCSLILPAFNLVL